MPTWNDVVGCLIVLCLCVCMCMFFNELKQNTDASADSTKSTSVLLQSTKCMRGSLHMNTLANTYKKMSVCPH